MADEAREQCVEQRGPVGLAGKLLPKRRGRRETVAQNRKIARASASRREPRKRTREVGHGLERRAGPLTPKRILVEPGDQREPLLDLALVGQRRRDVGREQTPSRGRLAAVDLAEQAAGDAARDRPAKLQAVAGGSVDRHVRRARHAARRIEEDARALLRRIEIGEQPARCRKLGPCRAADAVERCQAEARLESALAGHAVEAALARRRAQSRHRGIRDGLSWRQACQLGGKLARAAGDQLEPSRRDVGGGDGPFVARATDRRQPVGGRGFEQSLFRQRSRRDEADDRPLDERLRPARLARLGRALGLLGDGNAVPRPDQPREIGFGGMHGDAAHRDRLTFGFAALSQRNVEAARGDLGVLEEELEKVAHPVEQQRVASLGLEPLVLLHHRCGCVGASHGRTVAAHIGRRDPELAGA